jgi:mannosyltransferase
MTSRSEPLTTTDPDDAREGSPPVDRVLVALTALAVGVGLVLRFLPRSGMWLDEALTTNISNLPLGDIGDALRRDGHPPLFYWLLHMWSSFGDSDWWLRALPGVFSVLTLPLTYLAGCRLARRSGAAGLGVRRTGLLALAVMSVMPFGIRFAAEARMYSLVVLLVVAGYLVVDTLLEGRRGTEARSIAPLAIGAAALAGALLWTHYWSMWLLGAVGLLALWRAWKEQDPARRAGARALVVGLVGGGVLFLPWVPNLLYQTQHTGTPWGRLFGPASVAVITLVDFAGAEFGIAQLLSYVLVVLIVLAGVAVFEGRRKVVLGTHLAPRVRNEVIVIAATMALGWATSYSSGNTFSSRYASVVYPLFVLCVAAGLATLRTRVVSVVVLGAVLAACTWGGVSTVVFDRSQTDAVVDELGRDVDEHGVRDFLVIACPDQLGVATQRQIDELLGWKLQVVPYPDAGDPRFVDWVDYGERNEASDPAAFMEQLAERMNPSTTVYLVGSFQYRTFEGKCEGLFNQLAARGGPVEQLVEQDDDHHDEVANLWAVRPST